MSVVDSTVPAAWVELIDTQVRLLEGRYRTRIIEAGAQEAPALVLLHGTGGHAENWARNIRRLGEHFHVIAPDFQWHGRSGTDDFDPEIIPTLVDQVVDVLDLLGIEQAAVEGQSLGGWVAMRTALAYPTRVSALVLTTTQGYQPDEGAIPGYVEPNWASNLDSSLETLRNPSFENVYARMARILADPSRLTEEAVLIRQALYRRPELAAVQQRFITEYLGGTTARRHLVTDALAATITAPTLVYWGDANRTPPALGEHLARTVADGRFHCARDTGHWAQYESAEEHDRVVIDFLLSHLSTQPSNDRETDMTQPDLVGRWDIVSWEQVYDDGRVTRPMGDRLRGFIRYTADGDMCCMLLKADRPDFTTGAQWDADDVEKAAAYQSMLAYAGTYDVTPGDEPGRGVVTHHVQFSLFPNWSGGDQRRSYVFGADGTVALEARLEEGTPQARVARLLWRRHSTPNQEVTP